MAYSRLFCGTEITVAVSGGHIYVLNSTTGDVISQCWTARDGCSKEAKTEGPIIAAAINEDERYLVTVGENKILSLWQLPQLGLINERELPKRPTKLVFTKDTRTILVSDKFGDVFSYPFDFVPPETKTVRDDFASHENPSDGQLILGHASPLTSFVLSHDEKYIITADRDEHIRVSWYPEGYNIEMYCLGHRKYVSAIHIPKFASETLISGGGDTSLKMWNWRSGECTGEVEIWDAVEPFVAVKNDKRREEGEMEKRKGKGKKSKRRRIAVSKEGGENEEGTGEKVLVVSKIDSIESGEKQFVLFSAVGVTALFVFEYPGGTVGWCDLRHPVVDFALDGRGGIWVSLDNAAGTGCVRCVEVGETGEVAEKEGALLWSLNGQRLAGEGADLYGDLQGMPKWRGERGGPENSRRAAGRMKNRQNVVDRS